MGLKEIIKSTALYGTALGLAWTGDTIDKTKRILDSKSDLEISLARFFSDWLPIDKEIAIKYIDNLPDWTSPVLYTTSIVAAAMSGHFLAKGLSSRNREKRDYKKLEATGIVYGEI